MELHISVDLTTELIHQENKQAHAKMKPAWHERPLNKH